MRSLMPIVGVLFLIGCGSDQGAMGGGGAGGPALRGNSPSARILLRKDGTCKSRTVPPSHILIKDDDEDISWDLKVKDQCLDGDTHLVIKWHDGTTAKTVITDPAKVPTTCLEINTKDHGNKNHISCKLRNPAPVGKFFYNVYLRNGTSDTLIEDPDVEIIMF